MIEERLRQSEISEEFRVIEGFLDDTLPDFPDRPIAFLHLDVDLYPGYHAGLMHLFPKVAKGGLILFDEYREFPNLPEYEFGMVEKWPGCTRAVDEYLAALSDPPELLYHPETKKYYLIK